MVVFRHQYAGFCIRYHRYGCIPCRNLRKEIAMKLSNWCGSQSAAWSSGIAFRRIIGVEESERIRFVSFLCCRLSSLGYGQVLFYGLLSESRSRTVEVEADWFGRECSNLPSRLMIFEQVTFSIHSAFRSGATIGTRYTCLAYFALYDYPSKAVESGMQQAFALYSSARRRHVLLVAIKMVLSMVPSFP